MKADELGRCFAHSGALAKLGTAAKAAAGESSNAPDLHAEAVTPELGESVLLGILRNPKANDMAKINAVKALEEIRGRKAKGAGARGMAPDDERELREWIARRAPVELQDSISDETFRDMADLRGYELVQKGAGGPPE
jgi:hypothetical protein